VFKWSGVENVDRRLVVLSRRVRCDSSSLAKIEDEDDDEYEND